MSVLTFHLQTLSKFSSVQVLHKYKEERKKPVELAFENAIDEGASLHR